MVTLYRNFTGGNITDQITHNHWTIMAYRRKVKTPPELIPSTGKYRFDDIVMVKVDANTEKEALAEARKIIKRKGYRVHEVIKCDPSQHPNQELRDEALVLQLEMQKQMLKKLT